MTTGRINQVAVTHAAADERRTTADRQRLKNTRSITERMSPSPTAHAARSLGRAAAHSDAGTQARKLARRRRHDVGTSQRGRNRPACFCSESLKQRRITDRGEAPHPPPASGKTVVSRRRSTTAGGGRCTLRHNFPLAFGVPLTGSESARRSSR